MEIALGYLIIEELTELWIEKILIPNYNTNLNGVSESTNWLYLLGLDKVTLKFELEIPFLLDYIVKYVAHMRNHLPNKILVKKTCCETYYSLENTRFHFLQFGIDVVVHIQNHQETQTLNVSMESEKSYPLAVLAAFVGYTQDSFVFKVMVSTPGYPILTTSNIKPLSSLSVINDYCPFMRSNSKILFSLDFLNPMDLEDLQPRRESYINNPTPLLDEQVTEHNSEPNLVRESLVTNKDSHTPDYDESEKSIWRITKPGLERPSNGSEQPALKLHLPPNFRGGISNT